MKKILLLATVLLSVSSIAQNLTFADPALKAYLLSSTTTNNIAFVGFQPTKIDANNNGEISVTEAAVITRIWVENPAITNISGIEGFVNLDQLDFKNVNITSADLSGMTNVTELQFRECLALSSVNINGFTSMTQLACSLNPALTTVAMPNCNALTALILTQNALTALDASNKPNLVNIWCNDNQIALLNVSGCTSLQGIAAASNALVNVDVSGLTSLTAISLNDNVNLTSITAVGCTALQSGFLTFVNDVNIVNVDFTGCTSLEYFAMNSNSLESANFSGCSNLGFIQVWNNNLTSLNLSGCTALTALSCNGNALTSLDLSDCTQLSTVNLNDNELTSVNFDNCMDLTQVNLYNNLLTQINLSQRPLLQTINILGNVFLEHLDLHGCPQLLGLSPFSSNELEYIDISDCPLINVLEAGSTRLEYLNVQGCTGLQDLTLSGRPEQNGPITSVDLSGLTSLDEVVLFYFDIQEIIFSQDSNPDALHLWRLPMTELDLPPSVHTLTVRESQLQEIDLSAQLTMDYFMGTDNPELISIYAKNGSEEDIMLQGDHSSLEFICQDDEFVALTQAALNIAGLAGVVCNSYCSFTPGGNYNTITGTILYDLNNNGCEASDMAQANIRVDINDGTNQGATFVNSTGNYSFYTSAGDFTLTPSIENPAFFTISPATATISFPNDDNNTTTQNFCLSANGVHKDAEIVIAPLSGAAPGFASWYVITIRNKGNQTLSGTFNVTYDDSVLEFILATLVPTSQTTGLINWAYTNLLPFENRSIYIGFNVNSPTQIPAVNLGDILNFTATINPIVGDEIPLDNQFNLAQVVQGSFDPNDITCLEGDTVSPSEIGNYLHYAVNFENTGTAEAQNIVVKVAVDPTQYDIDSLQLLSASHANYTRISGNTVEFIFADINLGVAGDPPVGGHGNVLFKIRSNDGLTVGDIVTKSANIFFDYNFPIETLPAETVFQSLKNPDFATDENVTVYPNPAHSIVNIGSKSNIKTVMLYDVQGRLLQTAFESSNATTLDISSRSNGLYFLKITTDDGIKVEKIVKQ